MMAGGREKTPKTWEVKVFSTKLNQKNQEDAGPGGTYMRRKLSILQFQGPG